MVLSEGEEKEKGLEIGSILVMRRDLLQAKPLLTGCGNKGPRARAGGFRSFSNYFSPQTTEAAEGP